MPRIAVDKQTRITAAIKKWVDNPYLIWFRPPAGAIFCGNRGGNRKKAP
jgi:hypothetical protein